MTDRHVLVIPVIANSASLGEILSGLTCYGVAHTVVPHADAALSSAATSLPVAFLVHSPEAHPTLLRTVDRLASGSDSTIPILVLASGLNAAQRSRVLSSGARDVLELPIPPARLRLHLRALRRSGFGEGRAPERFVCGPLTVDAGRWEVWMDGHEVALTRSEFNLLLTLVRDPSRVVPRRELARAIDTEATSKAVEAHISRLRKKVSAVHGSRVIEPVRGVGYRLGTLAEVQKVG